MKAYYQYVQVQETPLFTVVCLPDEKGKFPTVIMRSPYVDYAENQPEEFSVEKTVSMQKAFIENGYAVVYQHCRGCGKSGGDFIPYTNERMDGLALQQWVREQDFYNGELYLCGGSYTATVHFATAPFAPDIKGAVFNKQDCNRYNGSYRNGIYRIGYWNWLANMYKKKTPMQRNCTQETYNVLPFSDFTRTVFGEDIASFNERIRHPEKTDEYWQTVAPECRDCIKNANIPILLTTGFYDLYTGGVFAMWDSMDEQTKAQSALIAHPYDHSGLYNYQPIRFENGMISEQFGEYQVRWFNAIRGKETPFVELGKVTYYHSFGDGWRTDDFSTPASQRVFSLGDGEKSYDYDPTNPASFNGGLSINYGGTAWQDPPHVRDDVLTIYTPAFEKDTFIQGKMQAKLRVKSSCEDTCFYIRISLVKQDGDYGLRDDIQKISNFRADYTPNDEVELAFCFDEHAFTVKKGEKLRIDISSSAFPLFVRHTNNKGLFSEQTTTQVARNTILLNKSTFTIYYNE